MSAQSIPIHHRIRIDSNRDTIGERNKRHKLRVGTEKNTSYSNHNNQADNKNNRLSLFAEDRLPSQHA